MLEIAEKIPLRKEDRLHQRCYLISRLPKRILLTVGGRCSYRFTPPEQHATESARKRYLAEIEETNSSVHSRLHRQVALACSSVGDCWLMAAQQKIRMQQTVQRNLHG